MRSPSAGACLLVAACGPVVLVGDDLSDSPDSQLEVGTQGSSVAAASAPDVAALDGGPGRAPLAASADSGAGASEGVEVQLVVKSVDCGTCFELSAGATGGAPPYDYDWEDGSQGHMRRVCVDAAGRMVSVVARDANGLRSDVYVTQLEVDPTGSSGCLADVAPEPLCLMNPSFEGTPGFNDGQTFDAVPWSTCTDPSLGSTVDNTPDIANETVQPQIGVAPAPTHGKTYVALGAGEQVSQALCEPLTPGSPRGLWLDLTRVPLPAGVSNEAEGLYLEIWGGLAAQCSQAELLWSSPILEVGWMSHCASLEPSQYMDQITLRATTAMTNLSLNYLAVDKLVPVGACPSEP